MVTLGCAAIGAAAAASGGGEPRRRRGCSQSAHLGARDGRDDWLDRRCCHRRFRPVFRSTPESSLLGHQRLDSSTARPVGCGRPRPFRLLFFSLLSPCVLAARLFPPLDRVSWCWIWRRHSETFPAAASRQHPLEHRRPCYWLWLRLCWLTSQQGIMETRK